jgi:hypothetical protein
MPGVQSMSTSTDRLRLGRLFFLVLGIIAVLQFLGEIARPTLLQAATVSIQMSNPSCVQIFSSNGTCSIQIRSLTATGSDQTFSRLEVLLDGKLRVYMGGFFESSAFLDSPMMPGGLEIACGKPNDGGLPDYGRSYSLTANAYMADGTSASDSVTVFCPAYDGKTFLPLIQR